MSMGTRGIIQEKMSEDAANSRSNQSRDWGEVLLRMRQEMEEQKTYLEHIHKDLIAQLPDAQEFVRQLLPHMREVLSRSERATAQLAEVEERVRRVEQLPGRMADEMGRQAAALQKSLIKQVVTGSQQIISELAAAAVALKEATSKAENASEWGQYTASQNDYLATRIESLEKACAPRLEAAVEDVLAEAERRKAVVREAGSMSVRSIKDLHKRSLDSLKDSVIELLGRGTIMWGVILIPLVIVTSVATAMVLGQHHRENLDEVRSVTRAETKESLAPILARLEWRLDDLERVGEEGRTWQLYLASLPPSEREKVVSRAKELRERERQKNAAVGR